jgi:hypothetical protein
MSLHGTFVWTGRALQAECDDLEKLAYPEIDYRRSLPSMTCTTLTCIKGPKTRMPGVADRFAPSAQCSRA